MKLLIVIIKKKTILPTLPETVHVTYFPPIHLLVKAFFEI